MAEGDAQLAEANVARLRAPLDSPEMNGFVRGLDDVNWLAERSRGFVWRLTPPEGSPLTLSQFEGEGEVVVTLSVWESFAALQQYVYRTAHGLFMQRRSRWFTPVGGFTTALWWVPPGTQPSVAEGLERLSHLRANGPTPYAFSLRLQFDAAGERLQV